MLACELRDRAHDVACEHARLEPELVPDVPQLLDGFFGRVHRDHRRGCHAIRVRAEHLGVVEVERARGGAPQVVVGHSRQRDHLQALPGVHDREVEADLVEPLVQVAGEHRGRAVARVLGGHRPPHRHGGAPVVALVDGLAERAALVHHVADELVGHLGPADVADEVHHHREHLELVGVGVDDRMVDLIVDWRGSLLDGSPTCSTEDLPLLGLIARPCVQTEDGRGGLPSKCLINVTALT